MLTISRRLLESPYALSPVLLVLLIPWTLVAAFGDHAISQTTNNLALLWLAILNIAVIGLNLAVGSWALKQFEILVSHRATVVFVTWSLAAAQAFIINNFVLGKLSNSESFSLEFSLRSNPGMWGVGLTCATYVAQSRSEYVNRLQNLQTSNVTLSELELKWQDALRDERQTLVKTINETIKPELKLISASLRVVEQESVSNEYSQVRVRVDTDLLEKLRQLITNLTADTIAKGPKLQATQAFLRPQFMVRDLPLDAVRTVIANFIIAQPLAVSFFGFHRVLTWFIADLAIFTLFIAVHKMLRQARTSWCPPNIFFVIFVISFVSLSKLEIIAWPGTTHAGVKFDSQHLLVSILYVFSLLLGSLDKYFVDSYTAATTELEIADLQLNSKLATIEMTRQSTRRDLARVLHGPIQGRLASVRLKLNMLDETTRTQGKNFLQKSMNDIADIIDDIALDVENLGDLSVVDSGPTTEEQIAILKQNWESFMQVRFACSTPVAQILANDPTLDRKIASACLEVTTNASRHGDASELQIELELKNDRSTIQLIAQDNGWGVQDSPVAGIGLQEIELDGGKWDFKPCPKGARLLVEFPLPATH